MKMQETERAKRRDDVLAAIAVGMGAIFVSFMAYDYIGSKTGWGRAGGGLAKIYAFVSLLIPVLGIVAGMSALSRFQRKKPIQSATAQRP